MVTLYQFDTSRYCEKARWALDYKGIPYVAKNLIPGPHVTTTKRLAPETSVPIIVDEGTAVQDSTAIISYLDQKYLERPLTPPDGDEAKQALEWEEYLDDEIGITARLLFYYHALPDRRFSTRVLLRGAPWYGYPLYRLIFPQVRSAMEKGMQINADSARQSETRLMAACQTLNKELEHRSFLVGNRFSRADLTACALLSSLCRPGESAGQVAKSLPEALVTLRQEHQDDRCFGWVSEVYREYRTPSAACPPHDALFRVKLVYLKPSHHSILGYARRFALEPSQSNHIKSP